LWDAYLTAEEYERERDASMTSLRLAIVRKILLVDGGEMESS